MIVTCPKTYVSYFCNNKLLIQYQAQKDLFMPSLCVFAQIIIEKNYLLRNFLVRIQINFFFFFFIPFFPSLPPSFFLL